MSWTRLIRFVDHSGRETFGEPCIDDAQDLTKLLAQDDLWAVEYQGHSPVSALVKGDKIHVKKVLDILKPSDVPIVRCIGLNYTKHSWSTLLIVSAHAL
jgi:hypothetical protein